METVSKTLKNEESEPVNHSRNKLKLISIIIPVYNGKNVIEQCLQSIFASALEVGVEVIVVDDGSTDNTSHLVKQFPCQYYRIEKSGVAAARNAGIKKAKGELLFFFDADVRLKPDTLQRFLRHFEEDDDAYIIQGRWDKHSPSPTFFSRFSLLKYRYFFVGWFNNRKRFETANLETGCLAIRAEILEDFEKFHEGYKASGGEEYELGMRFIEKYSIFYYSDLFVEHMFGSLVGTVKKIYRRTINFALLSFEADNRKKFMRLNKLTVPMQEKISLIIIALWFCSGLVFFADVARGFWVVGILLFLYIFNIAKFLMFLAGEESIPFAIASAFAHVIIMVPRLLGVCTAVYLFYIVGKRKYRI